MFFEGLKNSFANKQVDFYFACVTKSNELAIIFAILLIFCISLLPGIERIGCFCIKHQTVLGKLIGHKLMISAKYKRKKISQLISPMTF